MTNDLEVLYSPATREVELTCSPDQLIQLSAAIIGGSGELAAQPVSRPSPYGESLRGIRVLRTESTKVFMTVDSESGLLEISGSRPYLEVLGKNLRDLADEPNLDEHIHIDYFPGHYYLEESSSPVVVRLLR